MSIKFSDKTAKVSYRKFEIHIYDVKLHDGKWYCTAMITSPLVAQHVDCTKLHFYFDCETDDEAIEKTKQSAAAWIENNAF